jgi:uncharacterized protein YgiM (DUF1202 family)
METMVSSGLNPAEEGYFLEREGSCPIKSGMILVFKRGIDMLNDSSAKRKIVLQKPIKAEFKLVNPSRNETPIAYFYDIHPFLKDTVQNLTPDELMFYAERIYPLFEVFEIHNYHVQDNDGYVNIREKATTSSKVIGTAKNGEYVCFVSFDEHDPNWVYIKYKGISGYIHKSRLVRE